MVINNKKNKTLIFIMALAPILFCIVLFPFMEDPVPIHSSILGDIDKLGSKYILIVPTIFMALLPLIQFFKAIYNNIIWAITAFFYVTLFPFYFAAVYHGDITYSNNNVYIGLINHIKGNSINLIIAVIFLVFLFMGVCANRINQNAALGLRNTWTLKSKRTWDEVHSSSRVDFSLCALFNLLIMALPILSGTIKLALSLLSVFVVFLVVTFKSYKLFKKFETDSIN
jgi:uncharacterized membrane protein